MTAATATASTNDGDTKTPQKQLTIPTTGGDGKSNRRNASEEKDKRDIEESVQTSNGPIVSEDPILASLSFGMKKPKSKKRKRDQEKGEKEFQNQPSKKIKKT